MRAQVQVGPEAELMWRRGNEDAAHTGDPRYYKSDLVRVAGDNLGFNCRSGRASVSISPEEDDCVGR